VTKREQDFGTGTILFQDDVGGLEVESPRGSGNFVPAPPIPGTVVFNIGDFLMRWSNGAFFEQLLFFPHIVKSDTLKSTLHRVRAPPNDGTGMIKERFSIPYVSLSYTIDVFLMFILD
jgi:isopenicillin N synthase-like dioxygenase